MNALERKIKKRQVCFACNAMQVYFHSAHLFPVCNLKTGQVLWCIMVSEFRTNLSEVWCQWLCVYTNTSNSLTSTQRRENNSTRSPWRAVTDEMLKPSEKEFTGEITVLTRIGIRVCTALNSLTPDADLCILQLLI